MLFFFSFVDGLKRRGIDPALVLHVFSIIILSTFMVEVSMVGIYSWWPASDSFLYF